MCDVSALYYRFVRSGKGLATPGGILEGDGNDGIMCQHSASEPFSQASERFRRFQGRPSSVFGGKCAWVET